MGPWETDGDTRWEVDWACEGEGPWEELAEGLSCLVEVVDTDADCREEHSWGNTRSRRDTTPPAWVGVAVGVKPDDTVWDAVVVELIEGVGVWVKLALVVAAKDAAVMLWAIDEGVSERLVETVWLGVGPALDD